MPPEDEEQLRHNIDNYVPKWMFEGALSGHVIIGVDLAKPVLELVINRGRTPNAN